MKKLYLICNAHIDPVWQWEWEEGASAAISTFNTAAYLLKEYDFKFCHNEAVLYKYIEEYAPALFSEIKELIKQGKWHVMGGWYLQPDCLMPSGEAIVRQILTGQRYFKEKFNVFPKTAINFDSFGHSRGLVQIIKKCGQDSYMVTRPFESQLELPGNYFIWIGYDGSKIKVIRCPGYGTALGLAAESIEAAINENKGRDMSVRLWGVGNHGGGPSRKDLNDISALQKNKETEIIHSFPEEVFNNIAFNAEYSKSLITCMPGCYTSMIGLKQKYVELENLFFFTEKMATIAYLNNQLDYYPEKEFEAASEDMVICQFHDILPGTCIKKGEQGAKSVLEHGIEILRKIRANALFSMLKNQKRAESGEYPIVVFNPNPYHYITNVEAEFVMAPPNEDDTMETFIHVYNENGSEIPSQIVKEDSNENVDYRKRVMFEAELEGLTLNRFNAKIELIKKEQKQLKNSGDIIIFENQFYTAKLNKSTGLLKSFVVSGEEQLGGNIFIPYMYDDNEDPWAMSDESLKSLGKNPRRFHLAKKPDSVFEGLKSVEKIEDGELCLYIEAFFKLKNSRLRVLYKFYKNMPYIDIDAKVFWNDINKMLKIKVPVINTGEFIGQQIYGTEELDKTGKECIAQRFVAVKNNENCFAVFNLGNFGCSFSGNSINLSLLRGAAYCAHPYLNREIVPKNRYIDRIDQGERDFHFRIQCCLADELEKLAAAFVQKPYALNVFPISDIKDIVRPLNLIVSDNITLTALKKAYGKDDIVIRLFNNSSRNAESEIIIKDKHFKLNFGKFEIKTVLYNNGGIAEKDTLII